MAPDDLGRLKETSGHSVSLSLARSAHIRPTLEVRVAKPSKNTAGPWILSTTQRLKPRGMPVPVFIVGAYAGCNIINVSEKIPVRPRYHTHVHTLASKDMVWGPSPTLVPKAMYRRDKSSHMQNHP